MKNIPQNKEKHKEYMRDYRKRKKAKKLIEKAHKETQPTFKPKSPTFIKASTVSNCLSIQSKLRNGECLSMSEKAHLNTCNSCGRFYSGSGIKIRGFNLFDSGIEHKSEKPEESPHEIEYRLRQQQEDFQKRLNQAKQEVNEELEKRAIEEQATQEAYQEMESEEKQQQHSEPETTEREPEPETNKSSEQPKKKTDQDILKELFPDYA